jgi:hypothetical protein
MTGLRFLGFFVLEELEEEDALGVVFLEGAVVFWDIGGAVGAELVLQKAVFWGGLLLLCHHCHTDGEIL